MNWMDMVSGLAQQYGGGATPPANQVEQHYDQVAQAAPTSALANALSGMFRSDQTPAFGQLAGQLFGRSGGSQQASVLNSLLASAGPAVISQMLSGGSFPGLSSILGGGASRQISPQEAAQVSPQEVQDLATHVEKHDPSVVDRVSEIYAQHPAVIKTLGSAALAVALAKIAQRTQS